MLASRFLYSKFPAIIAAISLLMCRLAASGASPQTSWRDSPQFYGGMFFVFGVAGIFLRTQKQVPLTETELAKLSQLRIAEISRWLTERVPWEACPEWDADDSEFATSAEQQRNTGAELWSYDSGPESWENMGGERGFAIVRQTEIIDHWIVEEN